jgi:NAD(P)-dependent dehydrogenase (short-subunit alcohol dehydrogenase family)
VAVAEGDLAEQEVRAAGRPRQRRLAGQRLLRRRVWQNIEQNNRELFDASIALNPTGRFGTPEETAYAVVVLASPRASRISGTNLVVDGALTRGVQL